MKTIGILLSALAVTASFSARCDDQTSAAGHSQQGRMQTDSDENEATHYSVPLQNATVSSVKAKELNNKKANTKNTLKKSIKE